MCVRDPNILGEQRVEGATQLANGPCGRNVCSRGLASGVDPCIRTAGTDDRSVGVAQAAQRILENPLDGSSSWLPLPTGEAGTIVMEDELYRPLRHGAEITGRHEWVQQITTVTRPSTDRCLPLLRARLDRWPTHWPRRRHWTPPW